MWKRGGRKETPHDVVALLLDVGSSMQEDATQAKAIADWIISRKRVSQIETAQPLEIKVFTTSTDELLFIATGSDETANPFGFPGVNMHGEDFKRATFDLLRYVDREVKQGQKPADLLNGLIVAIDAIKSERTTRKDVDGVQIVLITNGKADGKTAKDDVDAAIGAIRATGIDLVVIGPEAVSFSSTISSEMMIARLEGEADAQVLSWKEAAQGVSHFARVSKVKRAAPFVLEIAPDVQIPVRSYVKTKYNPKQYAVKFVHPEGDHVDVKRETVFVQARFANEQAEGGDDDFAEEKKAGVGGVELRTLERKDIARGFMFGKSRMIIEEEELKKYSGEQFREGKCLQLVQCAKKAQLNPAHLIGKDTRVFLIDDKASLAERATFFSLAHACQNEETVLIVRYAYNRAANPCLLALSPYQEDSGNMAFAGVRLAFYEDVRPLQFPPLSEAATRPTAHQLRLVDDLINGMQLSAEDGTDVDPELIMQPSYQRICAAARRRALYPDAELEEGDGEQYLQAGLRPSEILTKRVARTFEAMKDEDRGFELVKRVAAKKPRLEIVPENIDDLLKIIEETAAVEEKVETRPPRKLTFKEKAAGLKSLEELNQLRVQVDAVLEAAEDDSMFFPRAAQMLAMMRQGAQQAGLSSQFDSILDETRSGFWVFSEWMADQEDGVRVMPLSSEAPAYWTESKDVKDF